MSAAGMSSAGRHCWLFGLERSPELNLQAGRVVAPPAGVPPDRIPIQLRPRAKPKLVRPRNILWADRSADRARMLQLITWECHPLLRAARQFVSSRLNEELGLCLRVACWLGPPQRLYHFGGFNRRFYPDCLRLDPGGWRQLDNGQAGEGKPCVRIDCACVDLGAGRVLFAGGCQDHPNRAGLRPDGFLKSAVVFDALTNSWSRLGDMTHRRHGCGGCLLDGRVYVVGGNYCTPGASLLESMDVASGEWEDTDTEWLPAWAGLR